MSREKRHQKAREKSRRLDAYKRKGKILQAPLAAYTNVKPLDYHRQLLPQLLWVESILDFYGESPQIAYNFLDLVDALGTTGSEPVSGLVESFTFVPVSKRATFVDENRAAVEAAVIKPFGAALRLHSDCPMRWLWDLYGAEDGRSDLNSSLNSLTTWTRALLDREGEHSSMARAMVLARYMKAGKVKLPNREFLDELADYPHCADRKKTECMIRAITSCLYGHIVHRFAWGDAFWTTNGRISVCSMENETAQPSGAPAQDELLSRLIAQYGQAADAFFKAICEDHRKCVPDPSAFEKTSALSGLLARSSALGLDMLTERSLWKAEVGGILLRCLCDTLILLAWLLHKDDASLYKRFVQYSLGQQDLYSLKLGDYAGYRDAFKALYLGDDEQAEVLSKDSWEAQSREINLGSWAGIDTHKMAKEGGTKVYYDLVFSLCSADVHSQFISLARWNMVPCANPLHNYHLLPAFKYRIVNPFLPLTACVLLKEDVQRFFEYYKVDAESTRVLTGVLDAASAMVSDRREAEADRKSD